MIKSIVTDKIELAKPSHPVDVLNDSDWDRDIIVGIIEDLHDTANHWRTTKIGCLGLAANQIGYHHRIILVWTGAFFETMINPYWKPRDSKMGSSHEQCLSRPGVNAKVKRHKRIEAYWDCYLDVEHKRKYANLTARIVQHEVDHLNGIFINNK